MGRAAMTTDEREAVLRLDKALTMQEHLPEHKPYPCAYVRKDDLRTLLRLAEKGATKCQQP